MLTLNTDTVIRSMSAAHAPVAQAVSGDVVKFVTMDAMGNQYTGQADFVIDEDKGCNPATGPLYVGGAEPGDTLKVTIQDIALPREASMCIAPDAGVFGDEIPALERRMFRLTGECMLFNDHLSPRLNPMVGVIGVAPETGEISNACPGPHGGNMDNKRIEAGASVYLPVFHRGALLAIGDVHALMGDGEVCICGAEVHAEVTVRVEVLKRPLETVMVVGHGRAMTVCAAPTLEEAGFAATKAMRNFLQTELGMGYFESCTILSLLGDLCICEVVDPLMTCRMEVPLWLFEAYGYAFA
ncbi:MAG: acetamidase/formamidase family protein [Clostridia bacterium]